MSEGEDLHFKIISKACVSNTCVYLTHMYNYKEIWLNISNGILYCLDTNYEKRTQNVDSDLLFA